MQPELSFQYKITFYFFPFSLTLWHFYVSLKVSSCGMSDAIGPVHIKERPSSEMQSRIDAEVNVLYIL